MKRKLKDLKENECIKVNTLAEAKYFINKLRWQTTSEELIGNYIFVYSRSDSGFCHFI